MCELRENFNISRQAILKHLNILENAGLVTCRRAGRTLNYYRIRPFGAAPLLDWLVERGLLPQSISVVEPPIPTGAVDDDGQPSERWS
jgi:DNA-binding transcriptional ArsR family regulator